MTKLFEQQSREIDREKRQADGLGDRPQAAGGRRAADHLPRPRAGCWQPQVKNVTLQVNSIYNGWRFEDVWLDK